MLRRIINWARQHQLEILGISWLIYEFVSWMAGHDADGAPNGPDTAADGTDSSPKNVYTIAKISFGLILVSLFVADKVLPRFRIGRKLKGSEIGVAIERRLDEVVVPFVIRVCNDELPHLTATMSKKIAETEFWDWTFVGPQSHTGRIPRRLYGALKQQYQERSNRVKTSSLGLISDYKWGNRIFIFFGRFSRLRHDATADRFPATPVHRRDLEFDVLHEYTMLPPPDRRVEGERVVDDQKQIARRWKMVEQELAYQTIEDEMLHWTDGAPDEERVTKVFTRLSELREHGDD